MPMKIAVLMPDNHVRKTFIPPEAACALEALGEVTYNNGAYDSQTVTDLLADADVCVTGWGCPALDENLLVKASHLQIVAHTGGSVASIISPALYDRGITVISGNALYAESVAEGAVAYMLTGLRRIPYYADNVQKGIWRPDFYDSKGLLDRKVGLLGFGAIAKYLVPMLKPFRADITAYSLGLTDETCSQYGIARAASLDALFSTNDIISLHVPRTKETYHMVDKHLLSLMPDGALLVNTSRGSVVDECALADELRTGRIHAVLDVFEKEPLPEESPLRGLENVLLIPHMGGPTADRFGLVTLALAEDIKRMAAGEPLRHVISREYALSMTNDALALS